jgi:hypothetical protein
MISHVPGGGQQVRLVQDLYAVGIIGPDPRHVLIFKR